MDRPLSGPSEMQRFDIHFLRCGHRVSVREGANFANLGEALGLIATFVQDLMKRDPGEDWACCRFDVTNEAGDRMLSVPVLIAMRAITRRTRH